MAEKSAPAVRDSPRSSKAQDPASKLILGSASPRRAELLSRLNVDFVVKTVEIDEATFVVPGDVVGSARSIASAKYSALADHVDSANRRLLTADTLVGVDGSMLGKPADCADARVMLAMMSGRSLDIVTAVCFGAGGCGPGLADPVIVDVVTKVGLRSLTVAEIDAYIAEGEGDDKAGAIGLQGDGAVFIDHVDGCWSNVIGLPLCVVAALLDDLPLASEVVSCSVERCGAWRQHEAD